MALKIYSDAACTTEILGIQKFDGDGATVNFPLTKFTGAQLESVYLESQASTAGVTFTNGVSSAAFSLTPSAEIGKRVQHNGVFRGTITANDATTITISDTTYTAGAATAILSTYVRKTVVTDYTVTGNTLTMVATPSATQKVHAVPTGELGLNFGGTPGALVSKEASVWLKRTAGFTYDTLQVTSTDQSQVAASLTQAGVTFAAGVGSGFSGLTAGAMVGRALNHNGAFRGVVTANTTTTVTIDDLTYAQASPYDAIVYTVGSLLFAPDSAGSPGTYKRTIHPSAITTDTAVRLWVKDSVRIPTTAMNYPNNIISVSGIEYLV